MRIIAFLVFAALITIASAAAADEFGSKDEAIAMVKRVQAEFKKNGPDATFTAVSDKSSHVEKMGDYFVGVGIYK